MSVALALKFLLNDYLSKSKLSKQYSEKNDKKIGFASRFWNGVTAEEREETYRQFIAEITENEKNAKEKIIKITSAPFDHDGFRNTLETVRDNAIHYNKAVEKRFFVNKQMKFPDAIPEDERQRRKALGDKWRDKMTAEIVHIETQIGASTFFARTSLERETQFFLCGGSFEDMRKRCEIMASGTDAEKRELFESRLTEVLDFVEEMQEYKSDEAFLKAVEGKRWMLGVFSELDKEKLSNGFGFDETHPIDPALKKRWDELKDLGVCLGFLQNRVDQIVSPMYPILNPEDSVGDLCDLLENVIDEDLGEELGYDEPGGISTPQDFKQMIADKNSRVNPLFDYRTTNSLEWTPNFRRNIIRDQLVFVFRKRIGFDPASVSFYGPDGKKLQNIGAAAQLISDGREVRITDGALLSTCVSLDTSNGIKTPQLKAPSPLTLNKNFGASEFNSFLSKAGDVLSPEKKELALSALRTASKEYYSHNFLWRWFHPGKRNLISRMKTALPEKGVTKTEVLLAEKGEALKLSDVTRRLTALKKDFVEVISDKEKATKTKNEFILFKTAVMSGEYPGKEAMKEEFIRSDAVFVNEPEPDIPEAIPEIEKDLVNEPEPEAETEPSVVPEPIEKQNVK